MLRTPIGRLRAISLTEGVSFLLLLAIAMPLKYLVGMPEPVMVVGWIHGVLFILLVVAILAAMFQAGLSLVLGGLVFLASLVPFGPFIVDARLRRAQQSPRREAAKTPAPTAAALAGDPASGNA